jgi:hypothetical protein
MLTVSVAVFYAPLTANPVWPAFLTEVCPDSSQDYIIEIYNNGGYQNLDGFYLVTTLGSVAMRPGIVVVDEEYRALSQDDFFGLVEFSQDGDQVQLYDMSDELLGEVRYGDGQVVTRAPGPGESVCAKFDYDWEYHFLYIDFWYLDSSPTFGTENDADGAQGTIEGTVTDSDTDLPISGATVRYIDTSSSMTTNSAGEYSDLTYARKLTLEVTAAGYDTLRTPTKSLDLGVGETLVYDVELEPSVGIGSTGPGNGGLPHGHMLYQNIPNPFNPSTVIEFTVPGFEQNSMKVLLSIYDMRGKLIRKLVDDYRDPGGYKVSWNGKTDTGEEVGSGVYFYTLQAGDFTSTRKMVIAQ